MGCMAAYELDIHDTIQMSKSPGAHRLGFNQSEICHIRCEIAVVAA